MKYPEFKLMLILILVSSFMLLLGLFLLARFNSMFKRSIRNELLRKNIVVWMIAICLVLSISPTNRGYYEMATKSGNWILFFLHQIASITVETLFVFNCTYLVIISAWFRRLSFRKQMAISLIIITTCSLLIGIPINYFGNMFQNHQGSLKNLSLTLLFNFYSGSMCGLIYVTMSFVNGERKRILNEKELELTRMSELKTKAELDALHSKVNPHFLYNALNSIADLSVTDGKKARRMTIALADLFRYSINYSHNNFSTLKDEVAMTEVYLQIEKVRFEDQLNYSISMDEETGHYLVPRFILQPMAENAVKHGLKATGKMTEIKLEVKKNDRGLEISIADNGPSFPDELVPGYGVKSVFDKLDLLFPGLYEIFFRNQPRKEVSICINKLMKNEPAV